ncbi:MAG: protein phosphatase CheZ [Rhodospirillaceae bacterium]|nr:protein phosphatase CheZ [Rhodospirillaceae bacterium]
MSARRAAEPVLMEQVNAAREEAARPLTRDEVAEIITEVIASMEGDLSMLDIKLYHELDSLSRFIQEARQEIAAIRPQDIGDEFIPTATDELDAVVAATEEATGRILDSAEQIITAASEMDEPLQSQLTEIATTIFEASNFQDITGQRITKVVKTLKHIESKIDALVGVLGEEVERARKESGQDLAPLTGPAELTDADLLNGPQLPSSAIDQDEIDKLLASFD